MLVILEGGEYDGTCLVHAPEIYQFPVNMGGGRATYELSEETREVCIQTVMRAGNPHSAIVARVIH